METETALVTLAQSGDESAFEQLIHLSKTKLKGILIRYYHLQPTDVDEVIQISTIKAWKNLPYFRRDSAFTTWFYMILRNVALDYVKKRNALLSREFSSHTSGDDAGHDYELLDLDETFEETASTLIEKKELLDIYRAMIVEVMSELSPTHGQIIKLALEGEKSYREIANELNIPIGTVMSRLFFARKKAQSLIIQYAERNAIQLPCLGERR